MPDMVRFVLRALACAVASFSISMPLGASCGSASCPLDLHALQSPSERGFTLDLSFQYIDQDQPRIGSRSASVGEIASDHDEVRTINRLAALQAGMPISKRLQLVVSAPFVSRSHQHVDATSGALDRWNFGGFGDVLVQGRYRLTQPSAMKRSALWLTGGVKLPTGATHESSAGGEDAEITITPGSGSTDVIAGLTWQSGFLRETSIGGPMGSTTLIPFFVSALVRFNGRGESDYRRGRELQLNAGSEYPLTARLHLLGQLNARELAKDDVGKTDEDRDLTGGRFVYLSPGIRFVVSPRTSVYAIAQLPIAQHVNGLQLTSRTNYVAGVRWTQ